MRGVNERESITTKSHTQRKEVGTCWEIEQREESAAHFAVYLLYSTSHRYSLPSFAISNKRTITRIPTRFTRMSTLHYLHGFNNTFESEYIAGALPKGRNNPRSTKYYTEQLSGTAFTAPRCENRRTWLYRLQPSVAVTSTQAARCIGVFGKNALEDCQVVVDPLRCHPLQLDPQVELDFVSSLTRVVAAGDSTTAGLSIYLYGCNMSMRDHSNVFYNADGEFLIMPQEGTLYITTELGKLVVEPTELCVIPQGVVFQVDLTDKEEGNGVVAPAVAAKGYVLEVYHNSFRLPELGPIVSINSDDVALCLHYTNDTVMIPTSHALTHSTFYSGLQWPCECS